MAIATFETPLGFATVEVSEKGIKRISISSESTLEKEEKSAFLENAVNQLKEYFSGERREFDLALDPEGTDFQKRVWQYLERIPFGETRSYRSIAQELGDVKAIRAVASANGRNPLWIVIPCHRVIGSDGSLTGYAGGLWRKKWLLDHENPVKQGSLF